MAETTEYRRGEMDASMQQSTYHGVMTWSSRVGVPGCLAASMFFSSLLVQSGVFVATILAVVTFLFVHFVVRTFFSH